MLLKNFDIDKMAIAMVRWVKKLQIKFKEIIFMLISLLIWGLILNHDSQIQRQIQAPSIFSLNYIRCYL